MSSWSPFGCRPRTRTKVLSRPKQSADAGRSLGVLVLSQYVETEYALRLLEGSEEFCGYLLKDRVLDAGQLADAVRRGQRRRSPWSIRSSWLALSVAHAPARLSMSSRPANTKCWR